MGKVTFMKCNIFDIGITLGKRYRGDSVATRLHTNGFAVQLALIGRSNSNVPSSPLQEDPKLNIYIQLHVFVNEPVQMGF